MSGIKLHLAALAVGLVIAATLGGVIWLIAHSGQYSIIAFCAILGCFAAYCWGRAALFIFGWAK